MLTQELLNHMERDAPVTPARGLRRHAATIRDGLASPLPPGVRQAAEALLLKLDHLECCDRVAQAGAMEFLAPSLTFLPPLAAAA